MRIHRAYRLLLLNLLFCAIASAQELEPRSYTVIPKGFNAAALSYTISHGNVVADATSPIKELVLTSHIINTGYVRTFGLFGRLGKFQVFVPYAFLSGDTKLAGRDTSGSRTGFADARMKIGMNILGSPAMAPKDFQRFREETVLGASIVFSIPIGQYFPENVINIGSNRWGFKPEVGFSKRKANWYFEFYTGVWFFTKNPDYLVTSELEQEPIFSFQGHISYLFPKKNWLAVNGGYADGGQTIVNGIGKENILKNWRVGVTYSMPITRKSAIRALLSTGLFTRAGGDYTAFTVGYQYMWF